MSRPCPVVLVGSALALTIPTLTTPLLAADALRRWAAPAGGSWSDVARWDAAPVPNNGNGGLTYHAVIDAPGSSYAVNLNTPVTLDALTLDSAAATLRLADELRVVAAPIDVRGGSLLLDGGTVRGGSVTFAGAGTLQLGNAQGNRFTDGAVVRGDVRLSGIGARVLFQNGAWFTGDAHFTGGGATILGVAHDRALAAGQAVNMDAPGATFSLEGGSTITIAAGAVVRGRGIIYNGTLGGGPKGHPALVNHGRIAADVPGAELRANPDAFVNHGLIEATNGGRLHFFAGVHNETGRFRAAGGGRVRVDGLSGVLNDTTIEGAGSVMRLHGAGFAFNQDVRVPRDTMLVLAGTWVPDAALDVGGRVVIDYLPAASPVDAVRALLVAGRNGGTWDGAEGLRSTDASTTPGTALGYIESSELFPLGGAWGGEPVDESAVLIAFTRLGDANLDGIVNLADFNRLAQHFGATGDAHWSDGDFDYDGRVNLNDFNLLAGNFGQMVSGPGVTPADWAALAAAVPEPSVALPLVASVHMLARLRTRRRSDRAHG